MAYHHHPSPILVQGSLVVGQVFFGLGSVIAALGLPACNPFAFALYREIAAGLILLGASRLLSLISDFGTTSSTTSTSNLSSIAKDWKRFFLLGFVIFGNQAGVITGIKLAGPVMAAIWQPSQPIFTAAICMMLRWEPPNKRRIIGVCLAFLGCASMVLLSSKQQQSSSKEENNISSSRTATIQELVGHCLFFVNCLCTSLYIILSKEPLLRYPSLTVVAWSYNIAAVFMAVASWLVSLSPSAMNFFCPECDIWKIPSGAVFALIYFILFNSVGAYAILTWANQYATGTLVMGYTVLQPITAAIMTWVLLHVVGYPSCQMASSAPCLEAPGWSAALGMAGVFSGLALVIVSEHTKTDGKTYEGVAEQQLPELELT